MHKLIRFLIFDLHWTWLEFILSGLCELEMQIKLVFDEEFRHYVDCADTVFVSAGQKESYADENIPKETFYCEGCMYKGRSKLAKFFFGITTHEKMRKNVSNRNLGEL